MKNLTCLIFFTFLSDDKVSQNDPVSTYEIKVSDLLPGEEVDKFTDFLLLLNWDEIIP